MKIKKYLLILLLIILTPNIVLAENVNVNYDVENVYIDAKIDMAGSLHIREAFVINGSLNGYRRLITYKNEALKEWEEGNIDFSNSSFYNARGVKISKVGVTKINKDEIGWTLIGKQYDELKNVSTASKGENGVYTEEKKSNGIEIKSYETNENGYIVYYFDYFINQAVVLHNDVAEIFFAFFKLDTDDVKNVNIKLTTPDENTNDLFRFWAHGSLNGNISAIESTPNKYTGVLATLNNYKKGDVIEIRMTFDKSQVSFLSQILNNSKEDALDKIIEVETTLANDANNKRTIIKIVFFGTIILGILYLIGLIILWIYIYRKYDKEHKVNFDHKYYREFTGDYDVEVVDYLMTKSVSTRAMSASIMNLIYKKNISIEENSDKKNIVLKYENDKKTSNAEKKLLHLLFETIGIKNTVSLKEIEKYSSNYSTAETFMKEYDAWVLEVTKNAKKEEFFEDHIAVKAASSLYFILGVIIFIIILAFNIEVFYLGIIILLSAIAFLIYILTFKKWTKKGREHFLKWTAFKNFLLDFSLLKEKDIPDIILWDKYLVYATVLGIAKEVQKSMKIKLTEIGEDTVTLNTMPFFYHNMYISSRISSCISSSHINSITYANASSSMSSGSGFGGGFSGGGGHAGGGGGGGGGF